jgi:hypothetical protein
MTMRVLTVLAVAGVLSSGACTLDQATPPALTGPSDYATSLRVSANPDAIALGQSFNSPGQQSLIIVSVFDDKGQPKPNQTLRIETLVNGALSDCGQLSRNTLTTGSDGRASTVFTAPGTPPDCANFNSDGSVTVRATPVGTDFQSSFFLASDVRIFMALPTVVTPAAGFVVDFRTARLAGTRLFQFDGSISNSPGHTITHYAWRASDGWSESGGSAVVDHDFGSPGTYVVTLTVTDDIGQQGSRSALVTAD